MTRDAFARLCRTRDVLRDDHDTPWSIDRLAREAGMSPFHFIRRFHAVFGETPHRFRTRARLDRARQLLALDQGSVTDVCFEVGFSSLGSFSALFARQVGTPPSAYRRMARSMVTVPGTLPPRLFPGCLSLMGEAFAILEKHRGAQDGRLGS
jgi:AraC-like DNA-binding protein